MLRLIQKGVAEGIGTFTMVFIGCGAASLHEINVSSVSSLAVAISFGLSVMAMICAVGHISGAHFNPVVTLAFTVSKHFPAKNLFIYCLFQFLGAFLAVAILHFLLPGETAWGSTIPQVDLARAFIWEMILTFFLVFVIIAVSTDTRAQGLMAGAAIGATVLFCALVGGPWSGASMNPARSLAPAVFSGKLESLWIYFLGPTSGALLGAIVYRLIRCESQSKSAQGCCE